MPKPLKAAAVLMISLIVTGCGFWLFLQRKHQQQRTLDEAQFAQSYNALSQGLTPGMTRADVLSYLDTQQVRASFTGNDIDAQLNKIAATEWYCGYWIGVAELHFSSTAPNAKLLTVGKAESGDCL